MPQCTEVAKICRKPQCFLGAAVLKVSWRPNRGASLWLDVVDLLIKPRLLIRQPVAVWIWWRRSHVLLATGPLPFSFNCDFLSPCFGTRKYVPRHSFSPDPRSPTSNPLGRSVRPLPPLRGPLTFPPRPLSLILCGSVPCSLQPSPKRHGSG